MGLWSAHDFGNSLLNIPNSIDLGDFGAIIPNAEGIQIIFNENKWYAIITGGILPASTPKMIKVEFGTDLSNTSPTVTDWGNFGGLDPNSDLHMFKDGNNWYGITMNRHGHLLRFDFTSSFNNTPTGVDLGSVGLTAFPTGLYVINDNGFWRLFVIDSGDDLRNNQTSNSSIVRFDFGNSLLNTPVREDLGNPNNVLKHPRDITIIRNCDQAVAFIVNGNTSNPSISRMDFINGLGQPPIGTDLGNLGNLAFPHSISKLFRVNEDLFAFVTNVNNNSITRLQFAGCTNASQQSSTAQTPPPIKYNSPGTYNINLTIDDGLPTQSSVCHQLVVMPAPVQSPNKLLPLCLNGTVRLGTPTTHAKYLWNTGATTQEIDVSAPGKYWVDIDMFGCKAADTFFVEYYKQVDFGFSQNICNPYELSFSALGANVSNARWDFGDGNTATGQNVSHVYNTFGTYTITLTAFNGTCDEVITKVIRVLVTDDNLITTKDTTICIGASLKLETVPAIDFCWSPSTDLDNPRTLNPVATPVTDMTYYLNAKVIGNNLIGNGDFSAGNTGFTSQYTYAANGFPEGLYWIGNNPTNWHTGFQSCGDHTSGNGNMMVVNGSPVLNMVVWEQTIAVTPNTNYAFSTWITSAANVNPALLQFSINGLTLGNLISAPATTCDWTQFYATWNSGNNTTATISIVNQNLQFAGNDFALDDISFGEVLIKRDRIKVNVENPVVTASADATICPGASIQLNASGAAEYSWTPAASLNDATIQSPIAAPAALTEYTVTGKTALGCIAQDKVTIDHYPEINITRTPDTTVCRFANFPLRVSGGVSYNWSPAASISDINSNQPNAHVGLEKMKFKVEVTDINSCKKMDSVEVDILPYPEFAASASNRYICLGKTVTLNASGGDQYSWAPSNFIDDPSTASPVASPNINTTYSVHIQDNTCGFDSTIHLDVTVNPLPFIQAGKSNDINCNKPTAILNATGGVSYTWLPATGLNDPTRANPVAAISESTNYQVIGTNQYGCESSAFVRLNVSQAGIPRFVVPNAFSPNGDGKNDCFGIARWGDAKVEEFAIFNRWGQKLFSTNNPSICWDGRFNGQMQPAGAYAYLIRAITICGPVNTRGMVLLVR
ncbi:PKD domain-containing protein [Pseudoflavitalea rhizosphaerae]|uniref:PKD domain-containing protein n=1 Tax=Pseudoflavitalea rhizosphaerae TaxID=1884793 RepID=UPI000F8E3CF8|nr:PKD domain-containing protein [Pseudoflavitalea rhizosphaerae]